MLAKRLHMLRQQNKKTQADMASLLGITRQAYGYYEKGDREPDTESLSKLADYFEVSVDYLLGRTDNPEMHETNMSFFGGPEKYTPDEIEEMEAALKRYRAMKKKAAEVAEKTLKKS